MHVKLGALGIKMVENRCRAETIFSYGGPCGISFQMGVHGLISVNLGVLGMKKFENPCHTVHTYRTHHSIIQNEDTK